MGRMVPSADPMPTVGVNMPIKIISVRQGEAISALKAVRAGPVKASGITKVVKQQDVQPRKKVAGAQDSSTHPKPVRKPKSAPAQHARPSSPGIRGKVAEAPYKSYANSLKCKQHMEEF